MPTEEEESPGGTTTWTDRRGEEEYDVWIIQASLPCLRIVAKQPTRTSLTHGAKDDDRECFLATRSGIVDGY